MGYALQMKCRRGANPTSGQLWVGGKKPRDYWRRNVMSGAYYWSLLNLIEYTVAGTQHVGLKLQQSRSPSSVTSSVPEEHQTNA